MANKEWKLRECPLCGADVPDGMFCNECGATLPHLTKCGKSVVCPHCKKDVAGGNFCSVCGKKLELEKAKYPVNVVFGGELEEAIRQRAKERGLGVATYIKMLVVQDLNKE